MDKKTKKILIALRKLNDEQYKLEKKVPCILKMRDVIHNFTKSFLVLTLEVKWDEDEVWLYILGINPYEKISSIKKLNEKIKSWSKK